MLNNSLIQTSKGVIDNITLRRLLSPEVINRTVSITKIVISVLVFILVVYLVRELLVSRLSTVIDTSFERPADIPQQDQDSTEPTTQPPQDYSRIAKINIFGAIGKGQKTEVTNNATPPTTLNFKLVGTFVSDSAPTYAIIQEKKDQDAFLLNEMVFGKAKLISIFPDSVELSHNGRTESLTLEDPLGGNSNVAMDGGVGKVGEDEWVVDEAEIDKALENLPLLLQQARAVPYFKDGKSVGLRLFAIKRESLFEKIGLKNGDILKDVNGKSLADPSEALKIFEELKDERSMTIILDRSKVERQFKYEIQ